MIAKYLKKNHQNFFNILTKTKVRFRFVDKSIILENWGELIELDEKNEIKQVRYIDGINLQPAESQPTPLIEATRIPLRA